MHVAIGLYRGVTALDAIGPYQVFAEHPDMEVVVCAARRARGQVAVHNSMLVHVTRFTNVQQQVADQVDDYLYVLRQELAERFGGRAAVRERVRAAALPGEAVRRQNARQI
jgi:putative intracellular protease/amidase